MSAVVAGTFDPVVVLIAVLALAYLSFRPSAATATAFLSGLVLWVLTVSSAIAVYAPQLFWVRALQVLLLLYAVPFLLALGSPVAVLRASLGPTGQARVDAVLASRAVRVVCAPAVTSVAMLAVPWLLYLTPWYTASLTSPALGAATRIMLLLIGFGYFYVRLQVDPVPRRYSPLLSMGISVVESLADGVLGLVLWLGPLIAYDYYSGVHRTFGPTLRTDQTLGAGILWILGDVLGIPFLLLLMRSLGREQRVQAVKVDEVLDDVLDEEEPAPGRMWWESDPQLRERFTR